MIIDNVKYVRIVLTNRCNMSCVFCHQEGCNYNELDIEFELLVSVIKQLYEIGYRKIKLMGGEPMLYSQIIDVIKAIRDIADDIDVSIISNGSSSIGKYIELFDVGLNRLNISVHGWSEEYFSSNTGGTSILCKKIKSNIMELVANNKINKINYVLKKNLNEDDFIEMVEAFSGKKVVFDVLNLLSSNDMPMTNELQYSFDEIETLVGEKWNIVNSEICDNLFSLPSKRLYLENGCIINLKISKLGEQEIFNSCKECKTKNICMEGIKAIRITNEGILQPCLLRNDNVLDLNNICSKEEIKTYLCKL